MTDVLRRPHDRLAGPGPGARPPSGGAGQWAPIIVLLALVVASLAGWWLGRDDDGAAHRVEAGGGVPAAAPEVRVLGNAQEAVAPAPTTAATTPPTTATTAPPTTVASRQAPGARTVVPTTPVPATTSTVVPVSTPGVTPGGTSVTSVTTTAPTTTTTVAGCRNSADPACGPFRFDPQPGPDNPMAVQVAVEPAAPVAGQEVVFRLTLTDPDGVSYNGTVFGFGDGGIAGASYPPCEKFGPWDPPPRHATSATEVVVVRHTYLQPGTYGVSFAFEAGPFACVDSVTGRGDRPYASSATGTATVVVG